MLPNQNPIADGGDCEFEAKDLYHNGQINIKGQERCVFLHHGIKVEQIIWPLIKKPGYKRFLWVRFPFEKTFVDLGDKKEVSNPCFFYDFKEGEQQEARDIVAKTFGVYYKIPR